METPKRVFGTIGRLGWFCIATGCVHRGPNAIGGEQTNDGNLYPKAQYKTKNHAGNEAVASAVELSARAIISQTP